MKTYRSEQHGFEIDLPKEWSLHRGEAISGPGGDMVAFLRQTGENLNIIVGPTIPEPLEQTERAFKRYALSRQYTELEFGRITVGGKDHVWARYRMGTGDWAKKYLIVFGETEYAMTVTSFDRQRVAERESACDAIVMSFRQITPEKPDTSSSILERATKASQFFEQGNRHFQAGRYRQALAQFEKGKMVTHEFPWNFMGASMTLMQMIETGEVPKDQIKETLAMAEKNLQACLLISPTQQDYVQAMQIIQEYKRRYNVA
jgi:hypothetical protein